MANHSSPRTTKLYDRRDDETSLDEYEKVGIWKKQKDKLEKLFLFVRGQFNGWFVEYWGVY
jgi:hypothetical protein